MAKTDSFLYKNEEDKKAFDEYYDSNMNYFEAMDDTCSLAGLAEIALCFNIAHNAASILQIDDYNGEDDNQFDYDMWNPDFLASMAYSGGNPFLGEEGSIAKRKEFWLWYLDVILKLSMNPAQPLLKLNLPESISENKNISFDRTQTDQTDEIQQIIKGILDKTINLIEEKLNGQGWQKIVIDCCCLKVGLSAFIEFLDKDKKLIKIDAVDNFSYYSNLINCFNSIKKAMYQQSQAEGAWIMAHFTALNNMSYTITYSYDDMDSFSKMAKNPEYLVEEFKFYPRSKEFTPKWWQGILGKKAKYT